MTMITLTAGTCVLLAKLKQNWEMHWSGKVEYSVTCLVGSMSLLVRETCPWSGAGTCVFVVPVVWNTRLQQFIQILAFSIFHGFFIGLARKHSILERSKMLVKSILISRSITDSFFRLVQLVKYQKLIFRTPNLISASRSQFFLGGDNTYSTSTSMPARLIEPGTRIFGMKSDNPHRFVFPNALTSRKTTNWVSCSTFRFSVPESIFPWRW